MNPADKRLREAALTLHALHWRDREWLLRRLLPGMRVGLRSLLAELRALGIAPGIGAAGEALPEAQEDAIHAEDAAIIDAATPAEILGFFAGDAESRLPSILLGTRAWRWRQAVWDGLTPLQKSRIAEAMAHQAHELPPAWREALLHALAQHLRARQAQKTTGPHS
jgi:hypothetical protein